MSDAGHDQFGCGVCGDPDGHDCHDCPTGLELRAEKAKVATLEARAKELEAELDDVREDLAAAVRDYYGVIVELDKAQSRTATLEARIAELTRRYEVDLSRASEITRGALDDRDAARARIAELTRKRGEAQDWAKFYLRGLTDWQEWAATISPHPGPGEWHGDSFQREKIKAEREELYALAENAQAATTAARAERDEAVGLLERWLASGQCETVPLEERWKRKQEIVCGKCTTCQVLALLARLAAAPEKETTPPGPYSNEKEPAGRTST
jgi:hypothetical protein